MPMPPHPPDDHNEPTDPELSRAYLAGFDDALEATDQPEPDAPEETGMPEDIQIDDLRGRRLIVSPTAEGVIVRGFHPQVGAGDILRVAHELGRSEREVRGMLTALNDRGHVVAELDRDNARGLSDALAMAAAVDPS
jgi:hypothetical protein